METHEIKKILLGAYNHTPNTRADYFRIEAEKSGCNKEMFFRDLNTVYKQLVKFVNSKDYSYTCIDDDGNSYHDLNIIELDNFTDGRVIDSENITDLLKPLRDFGLYVQGPSDPPPILGVQCIDGITANDLKFIFKN